MCLFPRRRRNDYEMQDDPSSQQREEQEYEDPDTLGDFRKNSVPNKEGQFQSLMSPSTASDDQEYDYITTSASQAAASSHGDDSQKFDCTDCTAYNVISR